MSHESRRPEVQAPRPALYVRIDLPAGNPWLPIALRRIGRGRLLLIRVLGGFLILLGLLVMLTRRPLDIGLGLVMIIIGGYVIAIPLLLMRYAIRGLPRYLRSEPGVLEISDTGVRQTYTHVRSEHDWPAFERAVERPDMWILYLSRSLALYVPKQPLTDAQRAEITGLLASRGLVPA
jgi:hypothetical protein